MSLMGTLAKIAIGYAAAKGVDRISKGGGLQSMLGGGARVPASDPTARTQAEIVDNMGASGNPMQAMMDKMKESGFDIQSMMGGADGALGGLMDKMKQSGFDLQSMMGGGSGSSSGGGLLSSASAGGAGLAGILASLGGAASASGKGAAQAIDQFKTAETLPQAEQTASLMLRAMIQAAKADGEIDKAEQKKILETVGDDADPDDMAFIQQQLNAPIDVAGLAADTPAGLRPQVYAASLMTMRVDTQAEAMYLNDLAKAMGLNEPTVNALHMQMGLQPLYG